MPDPDDDLGAGPFTPRPDVVLVHGTTQSPTGFDPLIAALDQRGYRGLAPQLHPSPTGTAATHADQLADQLPPDLHRPAVLAHSAAGLLLPVLARRLDAVAQIWLAAAIPDYQGGRSLITELRADPEAVFNSEWLGIDPTRDPAMAVYFLFHDTVDHTDLAALRHGLATLAATDLSGVYAETPTEDPARLRSTYLLPRGDRTLRPDWMVRAARDRLGVDPIELDGGHNLYTASPEHVADAIATALNEIH